jgi:murein L,D-transpeptidase YcbB/YkuD
MFPNSHSVYLHDTPHRELFEKDARAFSSGCIRVQSPLELAALLLEDDESGWDRAAIDRAVEAGTTRTVTLLKRFPCCCPTGPLGWMSTVACSSAATSTDVIPKLPRV